MFNYSHSIGYCLLSYMCAHYRYYHPLEFITAFLNNAAGDDDIRNGAILAREYGISIVPPKYGISRSAYAFDRESNTIAKGLASLKHMSYKTANALYRLSHANHYDYFIDLLNDLISVVGLDTRQLSTLIHIDFFSEFGNQRELDNIVRFWELFRRGTARQIKRDRVDGSHIEGIVRAHSTWRRKDGAEAASYTLTDVRAIMHECENRVLSLGLEDASPLSKVRSFTEAMGYNGYVSGRAEDRPVLFVKDIVPVKRKKDGAQFGYNVLTQSIGSGIESRFTVFNRVYNLDPIRKGDVIRCLSYTRDRGGYFTITQYVHIRDD